MARPKKETATNPDVDQEFEQKIQSALASIPVLYVNREKQDWRLVEKEAQVAWGEDYETITKE